MTDRQTTHAGSTSQQRSWRALVLGTTLLTERLDDDLRREPRHLADRSTRSSSASPSAAGQMRMAQLADSLAHSRSRVTHTINRMEKAGLVRARATPPRTAAASSPG